jgi:hypothetical protein
MGGGQGGLGGFIDHFGWSGPEHLESKARSEVETLYGARSMDDIEAWRDGNLQLMLKGLKPAP